MNQYDPVEKVKLIQSCLESGPAERVALRPTLRWNLETKRKDLKGVTQPVIADLAALLNTAGGTLLIGVDAQGQTIGLEFDRLHDDRTFIGHVKELVIQWLGTRVLDLIDIDIYTSEGKRVCVAECQQSAGPIFLKTPFAPARCPVRQGPVTVVLPAEEQAQFFASRRVIAN